MCAEPPVPRSSLLTIGSSMIELLYTECLTCQPVSSSTPASPFHREVPQFHRDGTRHFACSVSLLHDTVVPVSDALRNQRGNLLALLRCQGSGQRNWREGFEQCGAVMQNGWRRHRREDTAHGNSKIHSPWIAQCTQQSQRTHDLRVSQPRALVRRCRSVAALPRIKRNPRLTCLRLLTTYDGTGGEAS